MKGYDHYCGLARALEIAGERWNLLVVRELMFGGRRFGELLDGLPGLGANLLTQRLRHLEDQGIIRRTRAPPRADSTVYELTDDGQDLARAIVPLASWGRRFLAERRPNDHFRVRWLLLFLRARLAATGVPDRPVAFELQIGDERFRIELRNGELDTRQVFTPSDADVVVEADLPTLAGIATGRIPLDDALRTGQLTATGEPWAVDLMRVLIGS